MVYTCFEMIRDCRAGRPEGWRYFAVYYVPIIREILHHYIGSDAQLDLTLRSLRQQGSGIFDSVEPAPERYFVANLRQAVLAQITPPRPEIELHVATIAQALDPLTMMEREAAWFETMQYDANRTAALLRISPETVQKVRDRTAGLIRANVESWRLTILAENGFTLGREAATLMGKDCLAPKVFLDMLDGRTTWRNRELAEQQVNRCWHCVDHFCRIVEVLGLLRNRSPLSQAAAAPYWKILDVQPERKFWRKLMGA
jgi:hypothetical protein